MPFEKRCDSRLLFGWRYVSHYKSLGMTIADSKWVDSTHAGNYHREPVKGRADKELKAI